MIKAVFFDIDGTLTDMENHQMPSSTKKALELLREKGIKVVVSTGRAKSELIEANILMDEPFDGYIYMNGQVTMFDGKMIDSHPFTLSQINKIKSFLTDNQIACLFYGMGDAFCNLVNDELIVQQKRIGSGIPEVKDISNLEEMGIYQFVPLITVEEEKRMLQQIEDIKVSRWGECIVDAMHIDGGKNAGVLKVCEYLNIQLEETMAFGDGDNDIPMLDICPNSVAMGNASDEVKKHAKYITDRYDNDGVYKILKSLNVI